MVVPEDDIIRTLLISEAHDPIYSGHFGVEKTLEKLQRTWVWPRMLGDVRRYIRTCSKCQRTKHDTAKARGLLHPILAMHPWHIMTMDFVGKFAPAEGTGHTMCLVMVDKFSKYVLLEGVAETITAAETADILVRRVISAFGVPATVISDRGPQFGASIWKETLEHLGTQVALASSHHPQTDGQSERAIQTLLRLIRTYASEKETTWEHALPLLQFALNDAYCEATQSTPFRTLFGKDPVSPLSFTGLPQAVAPEDGVPPNRGERIRRDLEDVHAFVRRHQRQVAARMKERYDEGRKPLELQPGDLVLLSTKSHHLLSWDSKAPTPESGTVRCSSKGPG